MVQVTVNSHGGFTGYFGGFTGYWVVSQGTSRPNAENCSGFPPPTRQSASIEAELLGLTSIYSEVLVTVSTGPQIKSGNRSTGF